MFRGTDLSRTMHVITIKTLKFEFSYIQQTVETSRLFRN